MLLWKMVFLMIILFLTFSSSLFMSCLMFTISSIIVSMSFLNMNFNWFMYTMMILYLGGMMVLFMYMCSISSISKIESNTIFHYAFIFMSVYILFLILPNMDYLIQSLPLKSVYSLYLVGGQLILKMLGIYLIIGLLTSVFFMDKLQGPLKSFYVK